MNPGDVENVGRPNGPHGCVNGEGNGRGSEANEDDHWRQFVEKDAPDFGDFLVMLSAVTLVLSLQAPVALDGRILGRRAALSAGASAIFGGALSTLAYDEIPQIDADFAAREAARKEREAKAAKQAAELAKVLKPVESARTEAEFIEAADQLAVWVIGKGQGAIPEGVGVKNVVKRITLAYDDLPKRSYACERTRDNNGICYSPGKGASLAYEALIKELRKATIIQLGDYRRVEFNAF